MAQLYKASEWQNSSGNWLVNDTSHPGSPRSQWETPARMMGMGLDEYVKFLHDNYKPDCIELLGSLLYFYWKPEHYSNAHKYLLFINKKARELNCIL